MSTAQQRPDARRIWISKPGGHSNCYSDPEGQFTIITAGNREAKTFMNANLYSAAMAFVRGEFDIRGDIFAAIRDFLNRHHSRQRMLFSVLTKLDTLRHRLAAEDGLATSKNIQFHYDLSNDFYAHFLDSRLIYSAAEFSGPADSLEDAQTQKLNEICKDLLLRPGESLLDIGCGWGALISHAAKQFGTRTIGCTLSREQFQFAQESIERQSLGELVTVRFADYREVNGSFDKIASVGMFEHVGRGQLGTYFRKVFSLLRHGGLFLNRGIVRPRGATDGPETLFLQRRVFPGGELCHLDDVVREGENAGFETIRLRDLRLHYAWTCRRWVQNLRRNEERCRAQVGATTYRTWFLYLAASAVNFEDSNISAAQVLFSKRR